MSRRGCAPPAAANVSQVGRVYLGVAAGLGAAACLLAFALPALGQFPKGKGLKFRERVNARRAIEEVYHSKRLETNPSASAQAVSKWTLEAGVRRTLRQNWALEEVFGKSISQRALDLEFARIARETKDPETLQRIFDALGGDPYLIKEALVRPLLAERFLRSRYEQEPEIHREAREEAERIRAEIPPDSFWEFAGGDRYFHVTLRRAASEAASSAGAGAARGKSFQRGAEVELSSEAFERRRQALPPMGQLGSVRELSDGFVIEHLGAEDTNTLIVESLFVPKKPLADWLVETSPPDWEMELLSTSFESANGWNGPLSPLPQPTAAFSEPLPLIPLPTAPPSGACWERIGPPGPRFGHTGVWAEWIDPGTGLQMRQMIVWGGTTFDGGEVLFNTGYRYDPDIEYWTPISTIDAPTPRMYHTAVWTGSRMIVWGGFDDVVHCGESDCSDGIDNDGDGSIDETNLADTSPFTSDGGIYDPASDSWTYLPEPATFTLEPRFRHTAVWTGTEMIVWGGWQDLTGKVLPPDPMAFTAFNTGARYEPSGGTWAELPVAPIEGRFHHTAVWACYESDCADGTDNNSNGSIDEGEMIVWGGMPDLQGTRLGDGARYDPLAGVAGTWSLVSPLNAPAPRGEHTALWTDAEMVVWGGTNGTVYFPDGGQYDPVRDVWTPVPPPLTAGAGAGRRGHVAVWNDFERRMIVWGGQKERGKVALKDGWEFNPRVPTVVDFKALLLKAGGNLIDDVSQEFSSYDDDGSCKAGAGRCAQAFGPDFGSRAKYVIMGGTSAPFSETLFKQTTASDFNCPYFAYEFPFPFDGTTCWDGGKFTLVEYWNGTGWQLVHMNPPSCAFSDETRNAISNRYRNTLVNDGVISIDQSYMALLSDGIETCGDCADCGDCTECADGVCDDCVTSNCIDGVDNDGDGRTDEFDGVWCSDCLTSDCVNGVDDDSDGSTDELTCDDCADCGDCADCADCPASSPFCCDDGLWGWGCLGPFPGPDGLFGTPDDMGKGVDDDGDGLIDETFCSNMTDNDDDGDGLIDEFNCTNGLDDDNDGGADGIIGSADDVDETDCTNGLDDDLDGLIDEGDCENGLDDDGDTFVDETDCTNLFDDDGDGLINEFLTDCTNGLDDDLDGLIDEFDCTNGIDEDGDGLIDDNDCNNGIDDDNDGLIDEGCGNGIDDDLDGLIDEVDCTDCVDNDFDGFRDEWDNPPDWRPGGFGGFACGESNCNDFIDNNGDGLINELPCADCAGVDCCDDCADCGDCDDCDDCADCADCADLDCANGIDDDGDGLIDEFDCTNDLDDDGDLLIDEADCTFECDDCLTSDCANGVDDDGDGLTDEIVSGECSDCLTSDCMDGADNDWDGFKDEGTDNDRDGLTDEVNCADGADNDGDDFTDEVDCTNGIDDDGDLLTDEANCTDCGDCDDCDNIDGCCDDIDCTNGIDDDGDGYVDESDCAFKCDDCDDIVGGGPAVDCTNGVDDDLDGFTDETNCADGTDNNLNGLIDESTDDDGDGFVDEADCTDGIDNDGDGLIDEGIDSDKDGSINEVDCTDLADNDNDGLTDEFDCYNGIDDDGDDFIDEGDCDNGVDDDGDGLIDEPPCDDCDDLLCDDCADCDDIYCCDDIDCTNGIDDDLDGLIDESDCTNGVDDDVPPDGLVDEFDCYNVLDDDGDGLTDELLCVDCDDCADCADLDCANGIDDDGDGLTDEFNCTNDLDDDGDLLIDEADCTFECDDCLTSDCTDGVDNDGDERTDEIVGGQCSDCLTSDCTDGADNDGDFRTDESTDDDLDGLIDETGCTDGIDSNGDGIIDDVNCIDGIDNDGDGLTDETACTDGIDNDGDNFIDEPVSDCKDGIDNDGDGLTDETNCIDDLDNDFDGPIDEPPCGDCDEPLCADCGDYNDCDDCAEGCGDCDDTDCCDDCADIDPGPDGTLGTPDDIGDCTNGTDDDGDGVTDETDCTNLSDDDGDFLIDESDCANFMDNDGDGFIDEDNCNDGIDNDLNGFTDDFNCTNGWDDDGDGFIDEFDSDCTNRIDDDGDGDVDEADCADGIDNDFDGFTDEPSCSDCDDCDDCDDLDCTNGLDDDLDGFTDETDCTDGADNDEDGDVDETDCTDGVDNDSDGFVDDTDCTDGVDNDSDGLTDEPLCADCADIDPGPDGTLGTADDIGDCTNGLDDDGDTFIDETDCVFRCADCDDIHPVNGPNCTNEFDDDGDGLVDEINCTDGVDNDGDGLTDEGIDNDGDGFTDEFDFNCTDGIDNDGDGFTDETNCTDGVDNDLNRFVDESIGTTCADCADCADIDCTNGIDDDLDGLVDETDCTNLSDDDGDGLVDETDCTNGIDDDSDGFIDELVFMATDVGIYPRLDSRLYYARFWVGPAVEPAPTCVPSLDESGVPQASCFYDDTTWFSIEPRIDQFSPPSAWLPLTTLAKEASVGIGTEVVAVWDGVGMRMIVWGGNKRADGTPSMSGGIYDATDHEWGPDVGERGGFDNNAPDPRYLHTAVWTGLELITWGGVRIEEISGRELFPTDTGAVYWPVLDTWTNVWTSTTTGDSPSARSEHSAVWDDTTGEMVVWGGRSVSGASRIDGARFDPYNNPKGGGTWRSTGNQATNPLDNVINSSKTSDFVPDLLDPAEAGAMVTDPLTVTSGTATSDFDVIPGGLTDPFNMKASDVGSATLNWLELVHHETGTSGPVSVTAGDCADCDDCDDPVCYDCADGNCADGVDNDNDGLIDEFDCANGLDDDGDTEIDEMLCMDCDDRADCVDCADCADFVGGGPAVDCTNGSDDDGDGLTDETDCAFRCDDCLTDDCAFRCDDCLTSDCANGADDDGDGVADEIVGGQCSDCLTSDCVDVADNDGDGLTDEGTDDDGDGVTDEIVGGQCSDCLTSDCTNFVDDDGDGLTDEGTDDDGNSPGPDGIPGTADDIDETDCANGVDDDGDGLVDEYTVNCSNRVDDDLDGLIDETGCTDGIDSDGDGLIDDVNCIDGIDNDSDGLTDEAACTDGIDNDWDGFTDELYFDCVNGIDDDDDGSIDEVNCTFECDDCLTSDCADTVDNDGDGSIDEVVGGQCSDCLTSDCTPGSGDNDGDGLTDEGTDNDDDGFIDEANCTDGYDNDSDCVVDESVDDEPFVVPLSPTAPDFSVGSPASSVLVAYTLGHTADVAACTEVSIVNPNCVANLLKNFDTDDCSDCLISDCTNVVDDDGDGLTDEIVGGQCSDCLTSDCANSVDDDSDGFTDESEHIMPGLYQGAGTYSLRLRQSQKCGGTTDIAAGATFDVRTPANAADNTEVVLITPAGPTTIKPYGSADASPYDVTPKYLAAGPGTYQVQLSEDFGAQAELVGATLSARRSTVVTLGYTLGGNTRLASCAKVALIDPDGTVTILKPFGIPDFNPYDVTALYQGPGTYQIRLTEKANCFGTNDASDKAMLSNAHLLLGLSPHHLHTAVWTGTEMIVWGGHQSRADAALRSGARYSFDFASGENRWVPVNAITCEEADCTDGVDNDSDGFIDERLPSPRFGHTAVWTEGLAVPYMIVWGGYEDWPFWWFKGDGGRYDPGTDSWTLVNPLNAPFTRSDHTAVWTGSEMIVFGGRYGSGLYRDDGGLYDPVNDSWTPLGWSLGGRFGHTAVWLDNQMVVWGGFGCLDPPTCSITGFLNNGGRYTPGAVGGWANNNISTVNAPRPTAFHTAVAVNLGVDPAMLVWGGISESGVATRELGIYYPRRDPTGGLSSPPPGGAVPSCGAMPLSAFGDTDGNGCTDGLDLMRLARAFGSECGDDDFLNDVDFDNNDVVNGEDLDRLITNFGGGCGVP